MTGCRGRGSFPRNRRSFSPSPRPEKTAYSQFARAHDRHQVTLEHSGGASIPAGTAPSVTSSSGGAVLIKHPDRAAVRIF